MNKKLNTVYFLLGATVLNLLILVLLALVLGISLGFIYQKLGVDSQGLSLLAVLIILFGSIAGTFFLYSRIIKWVVKKWNLDNYIEPIFRTKRR
jgi:hypothetical protein